MIDFHSHIDLYPDPHAIARECDARGIYVLSVTTTPSAWQGTSALMKLSSRIRTALGLHPQLAHQRKIELDLFDTILPNTPYIGEVGLDGAPEFKMHSKDQLNVFNHILEGCSRQGGRILSIHSRRATSSVLDSLDRYPNVGVPIMHWFSGTKNELNRAINSNCWFSVGPAMFQTTKSRDLVSLMPRERILTETDGPFVKIDGRIVMPWDAQRASFELANMWKIPVEEVEHRLHDNLRKLLSNQN